MDALAALMLQIAWGADEALDEAPRDRTVPVAAPPPPEALPAIRLPAAARPPRTAPEPTVTAAQAAAAAGTLEELRAALAGFTACPLVAMVTHVVLPEIAAGAAVLFIDDAPGGDEDLSGRPLSGRAGALFGRMLNSVGLRREAIGIVPVLPWRPPGGRAPTSAEMAMGLPFLRRALALAPAALIVPLGVLAARTLTGSEGSIRKLRGRMMIAEVPEVGARKILPTCHPSALLREPALKKDAWSDLLTIQDFLKSV